MANAAKPNAQLVKELKALRREVALLKASAAGRSDLPTRDVASDVARLFYSLSSIAAAGASGDEVLQQCLDIVCRYVNWPVGHLYILASDGTGDLEPTTIWHLDRAKEFAAFRAVTEQTRFRSGVGLPGRVLSSGEPAWIPDVQKDKNFPRNELAKEIGVRGAFAFPVKIESTTVAVLEFFTNTSEEPDEHILDVVRMLGFQCGRVLERKQVEAQLREAHEELEQRVEERTRDLVRVNETLRAETTERQRAEEALRERNRVLMAIYSVDQATATTLDLDKLLNDGLDAALRAVEADAGTIHLSGGDGETLTLRAHRGISKTTAKALGQVKRGEGGSGGAVSGKKTVVIDVDDYSAADRIAQHVAREGLQTLVSTPLVSAGEVVGALSIGAKQAHAFPPSKVDPIESIGLQLGTAVHRAQLHEELGNRLKEAREAEDKIRVLNTTLEVQVAERTRAVIEYEKFYGLVEASRDFIAIAALDGTVLYVNPGGRKLLGLDTLEEVTGLSIADFLTEEGLKRSTEIEQAAVVATGHWEGESTLRHFRTGEAIPVQANSFLVTDPQTGQPLCLATVQSDITERKRAEEEIRSLNQGLEQRVAERTNELVRVNEELEQYTRAIDSSGLRLTMFSLDDPDDPLSLRMTGLNKAQEAYGGLAAPEVIGKRWVEVRPEVAGTALMATLTEVARTGVAAEFTERSVSHPDRWNLFKAFPQGARGVGLIVEDITERMEHEERIKELNRELEDYVSVIDSSGLRLTTFSLDDPDDPLSARATGMNKATETYTGLVASEAIGKRWVEWRPARAGTPVMAALAEVERTRVPAEIIDRSALHPDRWNLYKFFPQGAGGVGLITEDITERVENEERIKELNRELEDYVTMIDSSGLEVVGVRHGDPQDRLSVTITSLNKAAADGYKPLTASDMLGKRWVDFDPNAAESPILEALAEVARTRVATVHSLPDVPDRDRWSIWTLFPLANGGVGMLVADDTERHRNEERIRELNRELEDYTTVIDSSGLRVVSFRHGDPQDRLSATVTSMNKAAEAQYEHLTASDMLGKRWVDFDPNVGETPVLDALAEVARTGVVTERSSPDVARPDQWNAWTLFPTASGGVAMVIADATERHRDEEQIRQLNRDLEAANKELEAFSYSVSHDLRAPLRAMDGFSQALAEDYGDSLDQAGKDYVRRIRAATVRMGTLINDLLELSRISRSSLSLEQVNVAAASRELLEELRLGDTGRSVSVTVADLPPVRADRRLVGVVLQNLLGNAWKFTAKQAKARIEVGSVEADGQTVFFVKDNGAGFDMKHADKMFGVFQRMHSDQDFAGTGVGLATVQRAVARHGGRVWAEAKVDQGATFYFTLS